METVADRFLLTEKSLSEYVGVGLTTVWECIHQRGLPAFRITPSRVSRIWAKRQSVNEWRHENLAPEAEDDWLRTTIEIAAYLEISERTVRAYIAAGEIPANRRCTDHPHQVRIRKSVLSDLKGRLIVSPLLPTQEVEVKDDWLRTNVEIAAYLELSERTVRQYIKDGILPAEKSYTGRAFQNWARKSVLNKWLDEASDDPSRQAQRML